MNSSNNPVAGSRTWYLPLRQAQCRLFGGYRPGSAPTQTITDRDFTGHLHNNIGNAPDDIGLVYMQARWYLPGLGRFASADSIIPNPANPQQFNRYTYSLNNPLRYSDPTGHCSQIATINGNEETLVPDPNDAECWELAQQIYSQYGRFGLQLAALIPFSLEQLQQLHGMLNRAWNNVHWIRDFSVRHVWVQWHYAATHPGVTVELPIPGAGRTEQRAGRADLYREATGEIWEVKPLSANGLKDGTAQLTNYLRNCPNCTAGTPIINRVQTIDPINPTQNLYYSSWGTDGRKHDGLIFYGTNGNNQRTVLDVNLSPTAIDLTWFSWAATISYAAQMGGPGGSSGVLRPALK
ncbi:MAG: RHS repeat-associated core domain-containing protein [Ardenticatenaceae bacterium]|nr:RHS repeat-associated core domain-containing protein [Ardenticatenaceae bacterium]